MGIVQNEERTVPLANETRAIDGLTMPMPMSIPPALVWPQLIPRCMLVRLTVERTRTWQLGQDQSTATTITEMLRLIATIRDIGRFEIDGPFRGKSLASMATRGTKRDQLRNTRRNTARTWPAYRYMHACAVVLVQH